MATMPTVSSIQTATSPAMNTLSSLMKTFLDNVNAGKLVTDVGPGLALTLPLLMLIALLTGSEVVPAQQAPRLLAEFRAQHAAVGREAENLRRTVAPDSGALDIRTLAISPALSELPLSAAKAKPTDPLDANWTLAESDAAAALLSLGLSLDQAKRNLVAEAEPKNFAEVEKLQTLQKLIETRRSALQASRQKLETARDAYFAATGIQKNLEVWETNLALVAGFAVVLGVIISQVTRLVFFKGLFAIGPNQRPPGNGSGGSGGGVPPGNGGGNPPAPANPDLNRQRYLTSILKNQSPATAAAYQDLVTNHLRYAEGAINMAVPVLVFAFVYPRFAATFPAPVTPDKGLSDAICVQLWCIGIAFCMIGSSWITYRRFRQQERAWLVYNAEKLTIAIDTSTAIKSSAEAKAAADRSEAAKAEALKAGKDAKDALSDLKDDIKDLTSRIAKLE